MKNKSPESYEQQALFKWIKIMGNRDPRYSVIFAVPNAAKRNVITASKMKAEGLLAGVWDIIVPYPKDEFNMLFIEMKAGKNKLTPNQIKFREPLLEIAKFEVCYRWVDAKEIIENWFK